MTNFASTVIPTAFGAALDAAFGQVINLRDPIYGAKGDGVHDDSVALQSALNAACAAGKPLYVPSGTYSLQTRQLSGIGFYGLCLIPTDENVTIIGDGYNSVFTIPDGFSGTGATNDYNFFVSKDSTPHLNVEISNIRIYGNGGANLVLDSGTNVRRGYGFRLLNGGSFYCHDCYFEEMAGRNVLNIAASASPPGWTTSRVINNTFTDCGGALAGNENQSDHSTIYIEAAYSLIDGNILRNTNPSFNPFASPQHPVTGIEEHSARAIVSNNTVFNSGTPGNAVAAAFDVWEHIWIGNQFLGCKSNAVQPIAETGFKFHRFLFHSNVVEMDNTTYPGGAGMLQSVSNTTTFGHFSVRNNLFYCLNTTPAAASNAGIFWTAADYLDIQGNEFAWWQGPGLELYHSNNALGIAGGIIDNNKFINCGIGSVSTFYSIQIVQPDTNKTFAKLTFGPDNYILRTPQVVGTAPLVTRGIGITGGGNLQDITVYTPKTQYIDRTSRVVFTTTTNNKNVVQAPRTLVLATAASPTRGQFDIGGENVVHSDPAGSGTFGKVTTVGGSASEAQWATATAYAAGAWIRLSTSKVVIYTAAGTSDAATEPAPTVLGQQYTDGTATLIYVDTGAPTLKTYGAISA